MEQKNAILSDCHNIRCHIIRVALYWLSVRSVGVTSPPIQCSNSGLKMRNKKQSLIILLSCCRARMSFPLPPPSKSAILPSLFPLENFSCFTLRCVNFWIIYLKFAPEIRERDWGNKHDGATKIAALFTHVMLNKFTPLSRLAVIF